ncbi:hypothetical protein [Peribacillus sp. SI8-4]|uniref:hypothetical protein n=1 Tax=Peribacillus sp. SI8-4 TaxID=3048009 RepID=UPI002554C715|nr:hypothetical protein [Peribacillus sp. SI8-4]
MMKVRLQGISAGIIFTTSIFAGCYYGTGLMKETPLTNEEAKEKLEKDGFIVSPPDQESMQAVQRSKESDQNQKVEESSVVTYTIKIKSNMTSTEIAKQLFKARIIDDAAEFEKYMNEHGFSKKIQIGDFVVTNTMSYRQLANTISH